jgi:hypothetical protein
MKLSQSTNSSIHMAPTKRDSGSTGEIYVFSKSLSRYILSFTDTVSVQKPPSSYNVSGEDEKIGWKNAMFVSQPIRPLSGNAGKRVKILSYAH